MRLWTILIFQLFVTAICHEICFVNPFAKINIKSDYRSIIDCQLLKPGQKFQVPISQNRSLKIGISVIDNWDASKSLLRKFAATNFEYFHFHFDSAKIVWRIRKSGYRKWPASKRRGSGLFFEIIGKTKLICINANGIRLSCKKQTKPMSRGTAFVHVKSTENWRVKRSDENFDDRKHRAKIATFAAIAAISAVAMIAVIILGIKSRHNKTSSKTHKKRHHTKLPPGWKKVRPQKIMKNRSFSATGVLPKDLRHLPKSEWTTYEISKQPDFEQIRVDAEESTFTSLEADPITPKKTTAKTRTRSFSKPSTQSTQNAKTRTALTSHKTRSNSFTGGYTADVQVMTDPEHTGMSEDFTTGNSKTDQRSKSSMKTVGVGHIRSDRHDSKSKYRTVKVDTAHHTFSSGRSKKAGSGGPPSGISRWSRTGSLSSARSGRTGSLNSKTSGYGEDGEEGTEAENVVTESGVSRSMVSGRSSQSGASGASRTCDTCTGYTDENGECPECKAEAEAEKGGGGGFFEGLKRLFGAGKAAEKPKPEKLEKMDDEAL